MIIARSRKPSEASAKEGLMYYVYLIESLSAVVSDAGQTPGV